MQYRPCYENSDFNDIQYCVAVFIYVGNLCDYVSLCLSSFV